MATAATQYVCLVCGYNAPAGQDLTPVF